MISVDDVMNRLGVTKIQVEMAVYSGRLPRPDSNGLWDIDKIEFYLATWEKIIASHKPVRKTKGNYTNNAGNEYPRHTR